MKPLTITICLSFILGCDTKSLVSEREAALHHSDDSPASVKENDLISSANHSSGFELKTGDLILSAVIDDDGNITISNYPSLWKSKQSLIRFDGKASSVGTFSNEHCEKIRAMAEFAPSASLVRNGYPSLVAMEIPVFLSSDFMSQISRAAKDKGINFPSYYLKNPVDVINSSLELNLSDKAISSSLGNIEALREQIHLGQRGIEKNSLEKQITVYSGDLICDLISGEAKVAMIYPIKGEARVIKVVYDPLEIRFPS